jgi:predicted Zn-dependent protease
LLARGLVLALAIVVCGWFAIGIRQSRNLEHATAIISAASSLTAPQAAHVDSLLANAAWLNPGREVDILRGQAAVLAHHPSSALRILTRVTRSEPMNLGAWVALAQAAADHRGPLVTLAAQRIAGLDPRGN